MAARLQRGGDHRRAGVEKRPRAIDDRIEAGKGQRLTPRDRAQVATLTGSDVSVPAILAAIAEAPVAKETA